MDKSESKHPKAKIHNCSCSEEAKILNMTEQEEDIIYRMHRLVGDKWALIAGRIPGRTPAEIQRFWITRNSTGEQKHPAKRRMSNPKASLLPGNE